MAHGFSFVHDGPVELFSISVRVTGVKHSRRFLSYIILYGICYNLPPGDSSEN